MMLPSKHAEVTGTTPSDRQLRGLLDKWIACYDDYIQQMDNKDVPFHYNEVAQTGFLSAAAWLLRGVTLQDWRAEKFRVTGSREKCFGRNDLYVCLNGLEFVFESKYSPADIYPAGEFNYNPAIAALAWACDEAGRNCNDRIRRMGVCFVRPKYSGNTSGRLQPWLDGLRRALADSQASAIGWYFVEPATINNLSVKQFPGMVVLIQDAPRCE